jgi:hypothetical protein
MTDLLNTKIMANPYSQTDRTGVRNNFGQEVIDSVGNFVKLQESWNISGGPLAPNIAGYYPIFEYMTPDIRRY